MERKVVSNRKIVITLAALCLILTVATAGSIVYSISILSDKNQKISSLQNQAAPLNAQIASLNATIQQLNETIAQKNEALDTLNDKIIDLNSQIADLSSQISSLDNQVASEGKLIIDTITVTDERSDTGNYLHIACRINNTGTGNAYNAFLRTLGFNDEGLAIDNYRSFGGILEECP